MQASHREELAKERQMNEQNEAKWWSKVEEMQANEQEAQLRHQAALEQAKKERDKARAETEEQTRRIRELEADVDQYRMAFDQKDSAGRPWYDPFGFLGESFGSHRKTTKPSPQKIVAASQKSLKKALEKIDELEKSCHEKEACLNWTRDELKVARELQTTLDAANAEKERLRSIVEEQEAWLEEQALRESALTSEKEGIEEQVRNLKASLEVQNAARADLENEVRVICSGLRGTILGHIYPVLAEGMSVVEEVKSYFDDLQAKDNEMGNKKNFKVQYQDEICVISCPDSCDLFKELTRRARERLALPDDELVFFKYRDSEDDVISVHSTVELREAIRQFPSCYPKLQLCVHQTAPTSGIRQAGTDESKAAGVGEDVQ